MKNKHPLLISIAPRSILLAFFLFVFSLILFRLADIALLIAASGLFAAALHPSVKWLMHRFRMPKWLAILMLYLIVVIISSLIVVAVIPAVSEQMQSLSENAPSYRDSILQTFENRPAIQTLFEKLFDQISSNSGVIVTRLASATLGIFVSLFGFVTVLILAAYFLAGGKELARRFLSYLPEKVWSKRGLVVMDRISDKLGYWLRGQLFLCLVVFVLQYIGLRILGVDYALTLALVAALLESIPTFGALISGSLATLVALAASPGLAIAVAVYSLIVQQIQGNIITPLVMKKALGVPAVTIFISLLVFGKLFGLIGVIMAAPIAAIIAILIEEFGPDGRELWEKTKINQEKAQ